MGRNLKHHVSCIRLVPTSFSSNLVGWQPYPLSKVAGREHVSHPLAVLGSTEVLCKKRPTILTNAVAVVVSTLAPRGPLANVVFMSSPLQPQRMLP